MDASSGSSNRYPARSSSSHAIEQFPQRRKDEKKQKQRQKLPSLIKDAITTLRWPLDRPSAARRMQYRPLKDMYLPVLPTHGEIHALELVDLLLSSRSPPKDSFNNSSGSNDNVDDNDDQSTPTPRFSESVATGPGTKNASGEANGIVEDDEEEEEEKEKGGGDSRGKRRKVVHDISRQEEQEQERQQQEERIEHWAWIAASLILLGHGYVDHAHDLVGPLSYHSDLPYFHGPSLNTLGEDVQAVVASYVHMLVHRIEGFHDSEFGQTGWDNSQFWAGATMRMVGISDEDDDADGSDDILGSLVKTVRQRVEQLVSEHGPSAEEWFHREIVSSVFSYEEWDPRPLTFLCQSVLATKNNSTEEGHDRQQQQQHHNHHPLRQFAEQASLTELQVLLEYALGKLGYHYYHATTSGTNDISTPRLGMKLMVPNSNRWTTQDEDSFVVLPRTYEEAVSQPCFSAAAASSSSPASPSPATPNNSNDAMVITTSESPHRIVHVNDAWIRMCGYTKEQAIGQTFSSLLMHGPDTNFAIARHVAERCYATRIPHQVYLVNYTGSGKRFINRLTMAPLYNHRRRDCDRDSGMVDGSRGTGDGSSNHLHQREETKSLPTTPGGSKFDYMVGILKQVDPRDHHLALAA